MSDRRYWVFANKPEGSYGDRIWDMSWILEHKQYPLRRDQTRSKMRVGDVVYLRIYGQAYIGRFIVGGEWQPFTEIEAELCHHPGTIQMTDVLLWSQPVRQDLVIRDLSNGDVRSRVIEITPEDGDRIEAVQRSLERPGDRSDMKSQAAPLPSVSRGSVKGTGAVRTQIARPAAPAESVSPRTGAGGDMKPESKYWVFANRPEGTYGDRVWDMSWILEHKRYSLKKSEPMRSQVQVGDVVYLRIYGQAYIGRFVVGSEWQPCPELEPGLPANNPVGTFEMADLVLWSRPLPQNLVIQELSGGSVRSRVAQITRDDTVLIEAAQRIYRRLGFGGADGEFVVLEEGLEEAIKPNLRRMGLTLADDAIQQQFSMGVGVGRSDLICHDEHGDLVVIELKRGMTSVHAVGQVLKYVGWLRENVAKEGQKVHGWLVAGDYDEHLRLAAKAANIRLWLVRLP